MNLIENSLGIFSLLHNSKETIVILHITAKIRDVEKAISLNGNENFAITFRAKFYQTNRTWVLGRVCVTSLAICSWFLSFVWDSLLILWKVGLTMSRFNAFLLNWLVHLTPFDFEGLFLNEG